ncbi:MAG: hypothetical protein HQ543_06780 [Bacteroidetes bacterium]|nr:hypothetical protein [Bacteroidota bacterium]
MRLATILIPTYSKNEKYIDCCVNIIDRLWPSHPEIWVLSDVGEFHYKNKIIINSPHWTIVLKKGTEALLQKGVFTNNDYILLLHEDHIPFNAVQTNIIDSVLNYVASKQIKFISLTGHGIDHKVDKINGLHIHKVRDSYKYYSEHHPAIWNVEHLLNIMRIAVKAGALSPWSSEFVKDPNVAHYTVTKENAIYGTWPLIFSGFLSNGYVNFTALKKMNGPEFKELRKILIREYIKQLLPRYIQTIKEKSRNIIHRLFALFGVSDKLK